MLFTVYLHDFDETIKYQSSVPQNSLLDTPEIIVDSDRCFTLVGRSYSKANDELSVIYKEISYVRSLPEFILVNELKEIEVAED